MPAKASLAEYNGLQKAAILMIALGPEKASKLFKHLKEEEIVWLINNVTKIFMQEQIFLEIESPLNKI